MNFGDNTKRLSLPKWKSLARTPSTELASSKHVEPDTITIDARTKRASLVLENWRNSPTLSNALEAIDIATFFSDRDEFAAPAAQVLNSKKSSQLAKKVAMHVINPNSSRRYGLIETTGREKIILNIRSNKSRLFNEARNGLLLAEQARLYTLLDQHSAAADCFRQALASAVENRHILRSYTRFMVHINKPDEALHRIRKTLSVKHDPWVQAAEIVLSQINEVGSITALSASRNLDKGLIHPQHVSELASSLSTLEQAHGNRKKFSRRVMQSANNPTDNALAQIMWYLKNSLDELDQEIVDGDILTKFASQSVEAQAYGLVQQHRWKEAVQKIQLWQTEESFSGNIAVQGSFYSLAFTDDYEEAVKICEIGLSSNHNLTGLLNNLCVAQNRLGNIEHASQTLNTIQKSSQWDKSPTLTATKGMVDFSFGRNNDARNAYRKSILLAEEQGDPETKVRAKMHWLFEEVRNSQIDLVMFKSLVTSFEKSKQFDEIASLTKSMWEKMKIESEKTSKYTSVSLIDSSVVKELFENLSNL